MSEQSLKIATTLEKLVDDAMRDLQLKLDLLNVPPSVREPIWDALARRAHMKSLQCSGKVRP
jgi:hypothetical protein